MSSALRPDLLVPVDDGAADHLPGASIPGLAFPASTGGELDLAELSAGLLMLYVYPRTGRPGVPLPQGWDEIPGARGCTPQACSFRDHHAEIVGLGAAVAGLSSQPTDDQAEAAGRLELPFPLLSDPAFELADALSLPTFSAGGERFYRRLTLVAEAGRIVTVVYPVFPPDLNAAEVVAWLRGRPDS